MFQHIVIKFDSPICMCNQQNLLWRIENVKSEGKTLFQLVVWCRDCGSQITVPPKKFCALFELGKPYPGGVKPVKKTNEDDDEGPASKSEQMDSFFDAYEQQMKEMDKPDT